MARTIRTLPDGRTTFYTDYHDSQRGQATEDTVELLLRDRCNLVPSTTEENKCHDLDFRMDWKGKRIAVSLKDESKAPEYALKKKLKTPDIYFEIGRHNRLTGCWEESSWYEGRGYVTHYMVAWWLDNGKTLELRIYSREAIRDYLKSRYFAHMETYRPFTSDRSPQGWHKVCRLSPQVAMTQKRLYDNAECGYIPSNSVACDLLRFVYNESGTLEGVTI